MSIARTLGANTVVTLTFGLAGTAAAQQFEIKHHLKIENPTRLKLSESLSIYQNIADKLSRGYAASKDRAAMTYGKWRLFNTAPYRSATHGNLFVKNYANERSYDKPGAVIVKDSFTITADSAIFGGTLFLMEKLAAGASPETGNWCYSIILPDGSLFSDSTGETQNQVKFGHGFHKAKAADDYYLNFLPKAN